MLNSHDVCFIIYIHIIIYYYILYYIYILQSKKIVHIIFVPKIGVCFSFYPVSLIFEYEAKPHIRWPHIREYEAGESGANFTLVTTAAFLLDLHLATLTVKAMAILNNNLLTLRSCVPAMTVVFMLDTLMPITECCGQRVKDHAHNNHVVCV